MPVANIAINPNSPRGPVLIQLVGTLYLSRDLARHLKELMDQETDGTTYAAIESQFGLAAGQGQTVYNLLAALTGASGALEVSAVTQFCARLG